MPTIEDKLELHLALDEIEGGLALDETENDNDGTVHGNPQLLPDEVFGSCLSFDGVDDFVEVKNPFKTNDAFTISIWVRPAPLCSHVIYRGIFGHIALPGGVWAHPHLGDALYDAEDEFVAGYFTGAPAWVHVAWVKQGAQYRFYRGGELFATRGEAAVPRQGEAGSYLIGRRGGTFWKGQLAHARVYSRALSQDEIREVMLDDQTANASFRKSHPVEFGVYDEDEQPLLVVDDGHGGKDLTVELGNGSQRIIELSRPASPTPSADNNHFELKFRPGSLSPAAFRDLTLAEQDGWALGRAQATDGAVSLYLLNNAPLGSTLALQPGEKMRLTLRKVSADGRGGARGTRVELKYRQLRYAGEAGALSGTRVQHLSIVNERGKRNIPLHVGFLGSNTVLNDGRTPNELRLRITNSLSEDSIPLAKAPGDAPSAFVISFDVQGEGREKEWALNKSDDAQKIQVSVVRHSDGSRGDLTLHLPLNKIEGAVTPDESGNHNNGRLHGNPQILADEVFGSCMSFDGVNDFVEVKNPFKNNDAFTISIWVRRAAALGDDKPYPGIIGHQGTKASPRLWCGPNRVYLFYEQENAIDYFFTGAAEWVHIAWVKQGAQYRFYRGGELFTTYRHALALLLREETDSYLVGSGAPSDYGTSWKGQLAHARVYSRALSQNEIKEIIHSDRKEDVADTNWKVKVKGLQGKTPEWELTTTSKTALAAGEIVQVKLSNLVSSLPSGQSNLYVRYRNLPGFWDGQFVVNVEKSPLVYRRGRVGIGTVTPRSELDTGSSVMTGAANAYQKAQSMMTGGGTVTWGGPGGRLKWTRVFTAASFEVSEAIPAGHVNVSPPSGDIPAEHVWDGQPRSANADGVILKDWEALFAAHRVGGDQSAVDLKIVSHADYAAGRTANPFTVPSNWLLVAALNSDDKTVRLGTGVTLAMHSSSSNGSPVPVGTIMMWSGSANNIPGGWALCNGENGTPNLQDRFVLGAGSAGAGQSGEADRHSHAYHIPPATFNTTATGQHTHAFPGWYRRDMSSYVAVAQQTHTMIDSGANNPVNQTTTEAGNHVHQVTVDYGTLYNTSENTSQNRPRWFALCFIMKL